ncbi:hypothetical protein VSS74_19375 [Conexibacter stalactiti]|uniref:DUF202 domain-containing protein n=1 Tax=Conexibacter stalactiti TaxID=1940611 RepID=A0ABU4HT74_9ACTN|nr:hypothetical protein [Conexibacter stalactiti]MDW5596517.1 hypothetical protein [Conexibacter stalactiti]MEC5037159.1 hypothetical protein [Conexibacter stalactiti]
MNERLRDTFTPIVNRVPLDERARANRSAFHLRAAVAAFVATTALVVGEVAELERATDLGVALLLATPFCWLVAIGRDWREPDEPR